jgi:serine/threonine protein kinase
LIEPPKRIGPYTVLHQLARGGMAQVFLAQRDGSNELCVVKRLLAALELQDSAVRRFYREANVASALHHPNIAQVIDADFEEQNLYIAMEYIAGQTVDHVLEALMMKRKRFSTDEALAVVLPTLDGLAYAHGALNPDGTLLGLVHRDLSPRNVMIGYLGEVKIIDFGVARAEIDDFKTRPGVLIGTLQYFSPEQASGVKVDHRSDLYTISVVLYELLSGTYIINAKTPAEMLTQIQRDEPPPLSSMNPSIPPALERVVHRGLAKARDARWQSAKEMKRALEGAVGPLKRPPQAVLSALMARTYPDGDAKIEDLVREARTRLAIHRRREPISTGADLEGKHDPPIDASLMAETETAFRGSQITELGQASVTLRADQPSVTLRREVPTEVARAMTEPEPTATHVPPHDTLIRGPDTLIRSVIPQTQAPIGLRALLSLPMIIAMAMVAIATVLVVHTAFSDNEEVLVPTTLQTTPIAESNKDPRVSAREDEPLAPAAVEDVEPEAGGASSRSPSHGPRHAADRPARTQETPKHATDPGRALLRRKIAQLRTTPDGDAFKEVYDAISERARALAPESRRRIQSAIDAALRVNNVDGLAEAAEDLFKLETP